jgi:hypothetical protein
MIQQRFRHHSDDRFGASDLHRDQMPTIAPLSSAAIRLFVEYLKWCITAKAFRFSSGQVIHFNCFPALKVPQ